MSTPHNPPLFQIEVRDAVLSISAQPEFLRDLFAAFALVGLMVSIPAADTSRATPLTLTAWEIADVMLANREQSS